MSRTRSRKSAAPAANCNGTALRKATRRVSQLYDTVLAPSGLRGTQRSLLAHIARAGTPTVSELATALVLDRSALAHNMKPLQRDGLVTIVIDAEDRRARRVALTDTGRMRLDQSAALWAEAQARFERVFGVRDAAALRRSLEFIASPAFADAFEKSR